MFTRFKAIVDGTNGDTWLDRVDARLGQSNILASGAIVRERDVKGRHVALDIQIRDARIEDVLQLAVKAAKAPMTGRMELTTTFLLPAGEQDVIDRLNLNGRFRLAQARFSNIDVQRRIEALSLRARGKEDAEPTETGSSVVSNMRGRFVMRGAKIDFKELTFTIPGAEVTARRPLRYAQRNAGLQRRAARRCEPRGHDQRLQVLPGPAGAALLSS